MRKSYLRLTSKVTTVRLEDDKKIESFSGPVNDSMDSNYTLQALFESKGKKRTWPSGFVFCPRVPFVYSVRGSNANQIPDSKCPRQPITCRNDIGENYRNSLSAR